jgi:hypothetical protein
MDGTHRIGFSSDNEPILVHLPHGFNLNTEVRAVRLCPLQYVQRYQAKLFQCIQQYGRTVSPTVQTSCADKNGRDNPRSYLKKPGELSGIIKLVTGWHAVGHKVCLRSSAFHGTDQIRCLEKARGLVPGLYQSQLPFFRSHRLEVKSASGVAPNQLSHQAS